MPDVPSPDAPSPESPDPDVPAGFRLFTTGGPYFRALGPVYLRHDPQPQVLALRVAASHLNIQGMAHGGMLTTFADGALGVVLALRRGIRGGQVTVSLTADFLSSAQVGDWLEAHVTVNRIGKRLAYVGCDLRVGERHVLRSSAVFAFHDRPLPAGVLPAEMPLADG